MKIHQNTLNNVRWLILLSFIPILLFATYELITKGMKFLQNTSFIYVTLSIIFIYMAWQWSSNNLSKFPLEVIKTNDKAKTHQTHSKTLANDRKVASFGFFNFLGIILAVPFIIMILVQIWVAFLSGAGWVRVDFSSYGELVPELIIFNAIFVIVLFIIHRQWKAIRWWPFL